MLLYIYEEDLKKLYNTSIDIITNKIKVVLFLLVNFVFLLITFLFHHRLAFLGHPS